MVPTCHRWGTAGEPAQLARGSARCSMSLSRMWLAVFKMMHQSVGRQGCGQVPAALAALTDCKQSRRTGAGKAVTTVRVAINEQGRDKAVFIDLQSWELSLIHI